MKKIFPLLLMILSGSVSAVEICANYKPELRERWEDSRFTKENAKKAATALQSIIEKDAGLDPWGFTLVVEGYLLKRDAEIELAEGTKDIAYIQYCNFITKSGVHRE